MPLTADQEVLEHERRLELMSVHIEHFKTQVRWEPWKAMAVAAGAGSGITLAVIGIITLLWAKDSEEVIAP